MNTNSLHEEAAAPVDEATKAVIEAAIQTADRGEVFTEDAVEAEWDEVYQQWIGRHL